ncbi:MAG TPA: hypothetical protein QGF58_02000 [Myxococcota bacterium]|nr:hypothetical protein [Myxococcota bacterium]
MSERVPPWKGGAVAVADWAISKGDVAPTGLAPSDPLFAGEWDLGACQMSVLGLVQVIERFPDTAERYLPAVRTCSAWLASPDSRSFGAARWGRDEFGAAYVGYSALALARHQQIDRDFAHEAELDAMTEALLADLDGPVYELQTYPGEVYPPDIAVVAAALTVAGHGEAVQAWLPAFREVAIDPDSGMLYQALSAVDGSPRDLPRGSGTAFAVYFAHYADPELSAELYRALEDRQRHLGPFGGVREYPVGVDGHGDIDSGPVLFGIGVSPTGFSLAGARLHGDRDSYLRNLRTARLFGLPVPARGGSWYATGGGLGNAILLAMSTAGS